MKGKEAECHGRILNGHKDCDVFYNEEYDAYYCEEHNEWLEEKCNDKDCEFCRNSPDKPKTLTIV